MSKKKPVRKESKTEQVRYSHSFRPLPKDYIKYSAPSLSDSFKPVETEAKTDSPKPETQKSSSLNAAVIFAVLFLILLIAGAFFVLKGFDISGANNSSANITKTMMDSKLLVPNPAAVNKTFIDDPSGVISKKNSSTIVLPGMNTDTNDFIVIDGSAHPIDRETISGITIQKSTVKSGSYTKINYLFNNTGIDRKISFIWRTIIPASYDTANSFSLNESFSTDATLVNFYTDGTRKYFLTFDDMQKAFGGLTIKYDSKTRILSAESDQLLLNHGKTLLMDPGGGDGSATISSEENTSTFASISVGIELSCGVLTDGRAMCWGANYQGGLGDGTTEAHLEPGFVNTSNTFSSISAGFSHACGILTNGSAMCWGYNVGQLGDGTTTERHNPVYVSGNYNFTSISSRGSQTCGVLTNGSAMCWGYNYWGNLGDGTTTDRTTPVFVSGDHIFANISGGGDHTCGILTTGSAMCWGFNLYGQLGDGTITNSTIPVLVSGGYTFSHISAGYIHTCGVLTNGNAMCWGNGQMGQQGDGTIDTHINPVLVAGSHNFIDVLSAAYHVCGLLSNGSAMCWGYNGFGALGDNTTTDQLSPVFVSGNYNFSSISTGDATNEGSSCGILTNGSAMCWGRNTFGQLGDNTTINRTTPIFVLMSSIGPAISFINFVSPTPSNGNTTSNAIIIVNVTSNANLSSCILAWAGTNYTMSINNADASTWANYTKSGLTAGTYSYYVWCNDTSGYANQTETRTITSTAFTFTSISAGLWHICGVLSNGSAVCFGTNNYGQLGNGIVDGPVTHIPTFVNGSYNFSSISAGDMYTCGILTNGLAMCWGYNEYGAFGDGTREVVRVNPVFVNTTDTFSSISAGSIYACGVLTNGSAMCWGYNYGGLGDGTTTERDNPVFVSGNYNFTSISAGVSHTCGILTNGSAMCWGVNSNGELGDGTTINRTSPIFVNISDTFSSISAGLWRTCGILTNGSAMCWGSGNDLGSSIISSFNPVFVNISGNFSSISAEAEYHTCGVLSNGSAMCWGSGPLGSGSIIGSLNPVFVNGSYTFSSVSGGSTDYAGRGEFTCGILANGNVMWWGSDYDDRFGYGGFQDTTVNPVFVDVMGTPVIAIISTPLKIPRSYFGVNVSSNENITVCILSWNNTNYNMTVNNADSFTTANYTVAGMVPNYTYSYYVWCNDSAGLSAQTSSHSVTYKNTLLFENSTYVFNVERLQQTFAYLNISNGGADTAQAYANGTFNAPYDNLTNYPFGVAGIGYDFDHPIYLATGLTATIVLGATGVADVPLTVNELNATLYLYNASNSIQDTANITFILPDQALYNFNVTPSSENIVIDDVSNGDNICNDTYFTVTLTNNGAYDISDLSLSTTGDFGIYTVPQVRSRRLLANESLIVKVYAMINNDTGSGNVTLNFTGMGLERDVDVVYAKTQLGAWWLPNVMLLRSLAIPDPNSIFICTNHPASYNYYTIPPAILSSGIYSASMQLGFAQSCTEPVPAYDVDYYMNGNFEGALTSFTVGIASFPVSPGHLVSSNTMRSQLTTHPGHFCVSGTNSLLVNYLENQSRSVASYCNDMFCNKTEDIESQFTDGIDNDCNGLIDCEDPASCSSGVCADTAYHTYMCSLFQPESCSNGVDDNGNGMIDCMDPQCCSADACSATPENAMYCHDVDPFCDFGTNNTVCYVTSEKRWSGTVSFNDLRIQGATVIAGSNLTINANRLLMAKNPYLRSGNSVIKLIPSPFAPSFGSPFKITLNINGNLTMDNESILQNDATGFNASAGPGAGTSVLSPDLSDGSGAGHGGIGGIGTGVAGGGTYDSLTWPTLGGSGGGTGGCVGAGGRGGGVILINVTGTFTEAGSPMNGIYASGSSGIGDHFENITNRTSINTCAGAGSGGSIIVVANNFVRANTLHSLRVFAGAIRSSGSSKSGPSGGGGRIAIYAQNIFDTYDSSNQIGAISENASLFGDAPGAPGNSGTVFICAGNSHANCTGLGGTSVLATAGSIAQITTYSIGDTTTGIKNITAAWNQSALRWREWASDYESQSQVATYNISGLKASTLYYVYVNSVLNMTLTTDGSGVLPSFDIVLDKNCTSLSCFTDPHMSEEGILNLTDQTIIVRDTVLPLPNLTAVSFAAANPQSGPFTVYWSANNSDTVSCYLDSNLTDGLDKNSTCFSGIAASANQASCTAWPIVTSPPNWYVWCEAADEYGTATLANSTSAITFGGGPPGSPPAIFSLTHSAFAFPSPQNMGFSINWTVNSTSPGTMACYFDSGKVIYNTTNPIGSFFGVGNGTNGSVSNPTTIANGTYYVWCNYTNGGGFNASYVNGGNDANRINWTGSAGGGPPGSDPILVTVTPNSVTKNTGVQNVTITGSNFQSGAVVKFTSGGIPRANFTTLWVAPGGTMINVSINTSSLPIDASGSGGLNLTNPDGTSTNHVGFFTINGGAGGGILINSISHSGPIPPAPAVSLFNISINLSTTNPGSINCWLDVTNTSFNTSKQCVIAYNVSSPGFVGGVNCSVPQNTTGAFYVWCNLSAGPGNTDSKYASNQVNVTSGGNQPPVALFVGTYPLVINATSGVFGYGNYSDADNNYELDSRRVVFKNGVSYLAGNLSQLLLLHLDASLNSVDGEAPSSSKLVSSDSSGKFGTAVNFTSNATSTSNMTYAFSGNFNVTQGTVEFWVKPGYNGDDNSEYGYFHMQGAGNEGLKITKSASNVLNFSILDASNGRKSITIPVNSTNFAAGTWHYVAATWNAAGIKRLRLDSVESTTKTGTGTGIIVSDGNRLVIGAVKSGTPSYSANASFDEFRITGDDLGSASLSADYAVGIPFYNQMYYLNPSNYNKFDNLTYEYCPSDGNLTGTCVNSTTVQVQNSLPLLISAADNADVINASRTVQISAVASDDDLDNLTLLVCNSTSSAGTCTGTEYCRNTLGSPYSLNCTFSAPFAEGSYGWYAFIFETNYSIYAVANISGNFTVDSTVPVIYITPANSTFFNSSIAAINISAADTHLDSCWMTNITGLTESIPGCNHSFAYTLSDGRYNLTVHANDSAGNANSTGFVFTVDTMTPLLSLVSPVAGLYAVNNFSLNYTAADSNRGGCWYVLNGGSAVVLSGCLNVTFIAAEGGNNLSVFVNDSVGHVNSTDVSFTVDTIYPSLSLVSPVGGLYAVNNFSLDYTASDVNRGGCWYVLNGGSAVVLSGCLNVTFIAAEGGNNLSVFVNDSVGHVNSTDVSFTVDTIFPAVAIQSPINITYPDSNISLSYTVLDTNLDSCWYSANSDVNISLPGCQNTTFVGVTESNTVTVYVNDSAGHLNHSTVNFSISAVVSGISIASPRNLSFWNTSNIALNFSVDHFAPDNCRYSLNSGANMTIAGCANTTFIAPEAENIIQVFANDSLGNHSQSSLIVFTVDLTPPNLSILRPLSQIYGPGLILNISVQDLHLDRCSYSLDGNTSVLMPNCSVVSLTVADGAHNVTVYANDSAGNRASDFVNFTMDQTPPVTEDNSTAGIHWMPSVNITLNASDAISGLNTTYYCVYDYLQTACTDWQASTPDIDGRTFVFLSVMNYSREAVIRYFSTDNVNNSESIKLSDILYLVNGSYVDNQTDATRTNISVCTIINSNLSNSNFTKSRLSEDPEACYVVQSIISDSGADSSYLNESTLTRVRVNRSRIIRSNISDSNIIQSDIENANIWNASIYGAVIDGDQLVSGRIIYDGHYYYGPFNISKIFQSIPPSALGVLLANQTTARASSTIKFTYTGKSGNSVRLNVSSISSQGVVSMGDMGTGLDEYAHDGVYTSPIITLNTTDGIKTVTAFISDGLGNSWSVSKQLTVNSIGPLIGIVYVAYPFNQSALARNQVVTFSATIDNASSAIVDCTNLGFGFVQMTQSVGSNQYSASCIVRDAANGSAIIPILAYDSVGNVAVYNVSLQILTIGLSAVTNLSSLVQGSNVTLSWSALADAHHYKVYRAISPNITEVSGYFIGNTTGVSYSEVLNHTGVYYYIVSAVNSVGVEGNASNVVSARISEESVSPLGLLTINPRYVKDSGRLNVTYTGNSVGFNISLNSSIIDSAGQIYNFTDNLDGSYSLNFTISADNTRADGAYLLTANVRSAEKTLNLSVSEVLDNSLPNASMMIIGFAGVGFNFSNSNYTGTRLVILNISTADNNGVGYCRIANEDRSFGGWISCQNILDWILSSGDGQKTVILQAEDLAGNIRETNASIILATSGAGLDTTPPIGLYVQDSGNFTNINTSIHADWFNATDHESDLLHIPLTYEYSVGTSAGSADVLNWTSAGVSTSADITNLTLIESTGYYINVRAVNSANLTLLASSDGITIDTIMPGTPQINATIAQANWSAQNNVTFTWAATDLLSGVDAYSFAISTVQDNTPDSIPDSETSHQYLELADGVYYFHVKARDAATNWGNTGSYMIYIDSTPPMSPSMAASRTINSSNATFSWSQSVDLSGITDYYLMIGTSQGSSDVFAGSVGNVTQYAVSGLISGTTYYARVRAKNGAGIYSSYSDYAGSTVDTRAPGIVMAKPSGLVMSSKVAMTVITDKLATCQYRSSSSLPYANFAFTGFYMHQQTLTKANGSYSYDIKCFDSLGNINTTSISFTVLDTSVPTAVTFVSESNLLVGREGSFVVSVTSNSVPLGEISSSAFSVDLLGNSQISIDDFSVFDMGAGRYNVSFALPIVPGDYWLNISCGDAVMSRRINVSDLILTAMYTGALMDIKNGSNVLYYQTGSHIVGLASDSSRVNVSGTSSTLTSSSDISSGSTYIFVTKNDANIGKREVYLQKGIFESQINPSFGYTLTENKNTVSAELNYADIMILGNQSIPSGRYNVFMQNKGYNTTTGKVMVSVKLT